MWGSPVPWDHKDRMGTPFQLKIRIRVFSNREVLGIEGARGGGHNLASPPESWVETLHYWQVSKSLSLPSDSLSRSGLSSTGEDAVSGV